MKVDQITGTIGTLQEARITADSNRIIYFIL